MAKRPSAPEGAAWEAKGIQELALVTATMKLLETRKAALALALRGPFYDFYIEQATTKGEDKKLPTDFARSFPVEEKETAGIVTLKVKSVPAKGLSEDTVKMLTKHRIPMAPLPKQWVLNAKHEDNAAAFAAVRRLVDIHVAENPEGAIPRDFLVERPAQVTFGCTDPVLRALRLKKVEDVEAVLPLLTDISLAKYEFSDKDVLPEFVAGVFKMLYPDRPMPTIQAALESIAAGPAAGEEKSNVVPIQEAKARRPVAAKPVAAKPAGQRRAAAK